MVRSFGHSTVERADVGSRSSLHYTTEVWKCESGWLCYFVPLCKISLSTGDSVVKGRFTRFHHKMMIQGVPSSQVGVTKCVVTSWARVPIGDSQKKHRNSGFLGLIHFWWLDDMRRYPKSSGYHDENCVSCPRPDDLLEMISHLAELRQIHYVIRIVYAPTLKPTG